MKEQLITFETAKLAKEKGFENKTPHKLRRDYYNHLGEINGDVTLYIKAYVNKKSTRNLETIDAPTQSLLQKWLREEHQLYVLINYVNKEQFNWEINMFQHGEYGIGFRGNYEEALEAGLLTALKLI
tara:strand:- start:351 stop:731 length:381 start_codon:yes stop_codon:yes gene_type:complete